MTVPRGSTTDRHILRAGSDAERRHVPFYRGRGGSGALSDVSNFLLALLKGDSNRVRHTGFSLVRESGMNRDGRIAEWTGGRENARTKHGYERKRSIETGRQDGGRAGGRGGRRARPTRTFVTRHQTRVPPVGDSTDRL